MQRSTAVVLLGVVMASLSLTACSSSPNRQSTGEVIDDGVITAKVKTKLIGDPVAKAHQINVDTFRGNVSLSGFVESNEARVRALALAREVEGVKSVKDAMQIRAAQN